MGEQAEPRRRAAEQRDASRSGMISEETYRTIVENTHDVIMLTGPDGLVTYVSPSCEKVLGRRREDLVGTRSWMVCPEDLEKVKKACSEALAGGSGSDFEYRITTEAGETRWVSHSWSPISSGGKLQMIVSTLKDVTERKAAQQALQESEERYRDLLENANDLIHSVAPDGRFLYANRAWREALGYDADEIASLSLTDIVPPDRQAYHMEVLKRVTSGERVDGIEAVFVAKDGTTVAVEGSANCRFVDGNPVATRAIFRDVSDRKRAEQTLRQSEEKYRLLVENANEAIVIAQDGMLKFFNGRAEEMTGYSAPQLARKPFIELVHEDDRQRLLGQHQRRLRGESVEPVYTFRFVRKGGDIGWVEIRGVLIDWEGRPATLNFLSDITESRYAEEALQQSEMRYRLLAENASDVIWTTDTNLRTTYISPSVTRQTGYTMEEAMELGLDETLTPESARVVLSALQEELAAEEVEGSDAARSRRLELEQICRDGSKIWTEVHVSFVRDPAGTPIGIQGVTRDVTQRMRVKEELRQLAAREREDREALEATLAAAWEVTAQKTEAAICRAAVEAVMHRLGFDRAGIWLASSDGKTAVGRCGVGREPGAIGDNPTPRAVEPGSLVDRILCGELDTYVTEDYSRSFGLGPGDSMVGVGWYAAVALKAPQGTLGYLCADNLFNNRPISDTQLTRLSLFAQNVANAILSAREMDERMKAERLLQRRAEELEVLTRLLNSARSRMESVIESVGQGIISIDNEGQIHSVNSEAARILECEPGRMVGHRIRDLDLRFSELRDLALDEGGYPRTIVIRRDEIVVEAWAFRIRSAGESPGVTVTLTDITERDRMHREIEEANRRLSELAVTDAMTGLANHGRFQEEMARQVKLARRTSRHLSLLMIDVDHFKDYNDRHGHPAGDKILVLVGEALRKEIRGSDLAARYGGEEFAAILVETDQEGAVDAAERIRSAIETLSGAGIAGSVTVSVGLATFPADGTKPNELIEAADKALYAAKQAGRNRVCRTPASFEANHVRKAG